MKYRLFLTLTAIALSLLSACGGQPSAKKAILGTWVQDVPTSTTQDNLEATTSNTVLEFEKDGDVRLRRQLDLSGAGLPPNGVSLDVVLSGQWALESGDLVQTLNSASVTSRQDSEAAQLIADQLEIQASDRPETRKTIIALDRKQLILQDQETGVTDSYLRR